MKNYLRGFFGAGCVQTLGKDWRVRAGLAAGALMVAGVFAAVLADRGARPPSLAERASALMARGDYAGAASALSALQSQRPGPAVRLELARAMLGAGDFEGVRQTLSGADASPEAQMLLAEALLQQHRHEQAKEIAAGLRATPSLRRRAALIEARADFGRGDEAAAASRLAEALREGGEGAAEAWLFRARLALFANDVTAARGAAARAGEAGAAPAELRAVEIESLIREGAFEAARAALKEGAPRKGPVDARTAYLQAMLAAAEGAYDEAARTLRAIERFATAQPYGDLLTALTLDAAGRRAQGAERLHRAHVRSPESVPVAEAYFSRIFAQRADDPSLADAPEIVRLRLALAQARRRGDHDAVLAGAVRLAGTRLTNAAAFALGPHSALARIEAEALAEDQALIDAAAALAAGEETDARRTAAALRAKTDDPPALAMAGALYLAVEDDEAARAAFDQALAPAPDFAAAHLGRLRVDIRAGEAAAAGPTLKEIADADPANPTPRLLLARILRGERLTAEAVRSVRPVAAAIAGRPNDALFYASLLEESGDRTALAEFADAVRRAAPRSAAAIEVLLRADKAEEAAELARSRLIGAPWDLGLAEQYAAVLRRLGRNSHSLPAAIRASGNADDLQGRLRDGFRITASGPAARQIDFQMTPEARLAYLLDPTDWRAASVYGTALVQAGRIAAGRRVMREACFFSPESRCNLTVEAS